MNIITSFVLFLCIFEAVSKNTFNSRFRNTLLRIYVASDKKYIINEYKNKLVNKILSKYDDFNLFYNKLSEEEKDLINAILILCY
jgi:hypothetical protein